MEAEGWWLQRESPGLHDVWYHFGPVYVSEEVARLAIKYVWQEMQPDSNFRVRRW
jgi:hypothetical protein